MEAVSTHYDPVTLNLFSSRLAAVCDEMGAILRNAAFSPNIRDRLDFSCAIFDAQGGLCAQAAHIPVHLGSMAFAMGGIVKRLEWRPGDQVILNDPFLGGTHLPDVTLISPLFVEGRLLGFVANRAHHADIGGATPGSMPLSSSLEEEGLVIEPVHIVRGGRREEGIWNWILGATGNRRSAEGDLSAQLSANLAGVERLGQLVKQRGVEEYQAGLDALNDYAERLSAGVLAAMPEGEYRFRDWLDDDGQGRTDIPIEVCLHLSGEKAVVDFSGTAEQVAGNVNCPLPVTAAAVYYVFRCLMPPQTPACAGAFRNIVVQAPEGSLLNARFPAAVAAGNVETSSRVVDVVMGALARALPDRLAAASQGTMNNLAMGRSGTGGWDYYETMGGGMGASCRGDGPGAVQSHMTNTLNTPVEVLERQFPVRVLRYALRRGTGGAGLHRGGDGLVREFEFLQEAEFTLLTERRRHRPWGLAEGGAGAPGVNRLNGKVLPPKCHCHVSAGDRLRVETPGGGGYGRPLEESHVRHLR